MESLFGLLGVLVLVAANGFFVAAEYSLVAVRRTQLEQLAADGHAGVRVVQASIGRLDAMLSTTQLGVTLASLGLGWIGEPALSSLLEPPLGRILPESGVFWSSHGISAAISFVVITMFHIIFGEQAPKQIAIQRSLPTTLITSRPLNWFYFLCRPAIVILKTLSNAVIRMLGLTGLNEHQIAYSPEEIVLLVEASQEGGKIRSQEADIVSRALAIKDVRLDSVMVPRPQVTAVARSATIDQVLAAMKSGFHTRLPVYEGSIDHLIGVIHLKDVVFAEGESRDLLAGDLARRRGILQLPDSLPLNRAIQHMRDRGSYLAAVVDEFGGTAGIVTMEDLIEEFVGEIRDEFDREERAPITKVGEREYLIDGQASIHEVVHILDLPIEDEEVATIGGWVVQKIGHLPEQAGECIEGAGAVWQIASVEGRRIKQLRVFLKGNEAAPEPTTGPAA